MSETKLKKALTDYAGELTYMSFTADQPEGTSMFSHEQNRASCAAKFETLKSCWNRDTQTIERLEVLTKNAINYFAAAEFHEGRLTVKSIEEILWGIRTGNRET